MDKHYGQIVEYVVRREGYSITELAKAANVNRRTVYNWFQAADLKKNVIHVIGQSIRHDFSIELPEIFSPADFNFTSRKVAPSAGSVHPNPNPEHWKDKYLRLLEKYNEILIARTYHQRAGNN